MTKRIALLGATGNIGSQVLSLQKDLDLSFPLISFRNNLERACQIIEEVCPAYIYLHDPTEEKVQDLKGALEELRRTKASGIELPSILTRPQDLEEVFSQEAFDRVVVASSGFASLAPLWAAIQGKKDFVLVNKEALVGAGDILLQEAKAQGVHIYPADSEHSAIWQCLQGERMDQVQRLWITASGGPFLHGYPTTMSQITPAQAAKHPRWKMGQKISIDSATMINKGLEVLEACRLFDLPEDRVSVIVHPESEVHSLVEFKDGTFKAQLNPPDMRLPLALAITWPERSPIRPLPGPRTEGVFDLGKPGEPSGRGEAGNSSESNGPSGTGGSVNIPHFPFQSLTFQPLPEHLRQPIHMAREAIRRGKAAPAVFNAADEACVAYFQAGAISFADIVPTIRQTLSYFLQHDEKELLAAYEGKTDPVWEYLPEALADRWKAALWAKDFVRQMIA